MSFKSSAGRPRPAISDLGGDPHRAISFHVWSLLLVHEARDHSG